MSKKQASQNTFISHLSELRSRLVKSFIFLIISFIICYFFSEEIYRFLVKPYSDAVLENNLDRRTGRRTNEPRTAGSVSIILRCRSVGEILPCCCGGVTQLDKARAVRGRSVRARSLGAVARAHGAKVARAAAV